MNKNKDKALQQFYNNHVPIQPPISRDFSDISTSTSKISTDINCDSIWIENNKPNKAGTFAELSTEINEDNKNRNTNNNSIQFDAPYNTSETFTPSSEGFNYQTVIQGITNISLGGESSNDFQGNDLQRSYINSHRGRKESFKRHEKSNYMKQTCNEGNKTANFNSSICDAIEEKSDSDKSNFHMQDKGNISETHSNSSVQNERLNNKSKNSGYFERECTKKKTNNYTSGNRSNYADIHCDSSQKQRKSLNYKSRNHSQFEKGYPGKSKTYDYDFNNTHQDNGDDSVDINTSTSTKFKICDKKPRNDTLKKKHTGKSNFYNGDHNKVRNVDEIEKNQDVHWNDGQTDTAARLGNSFEKKNKRSSNIKSRSSTAYDLAVGGCVEPSTHNDLSHLNKSYDKYEEQCVPENCTQCANINDRNCKNHRSFYSSKAQQSPEDQSLYYAGAQKERHRQYLRSKHEDWNDIHYNNNSDQNAENNYKGAKVSSPQADSFKKYNSFSCSDDYFKRRWKNLHSDISKQAENTLKSDQNWRNRNGRSFDSMNTPNFSKKFSDFSNHEGIEMKAKTWQNRKSYDNSPKTSDMEYKKFCEERNVDSVEYERVKEIQQDLFAVSKEYSLAHCVAEDMRMGSGIATKFKKEFKSIDVLLNQRQKEGGLAILNKESDEGVRYIYYLVTKRGSSGKPTYEKLWSSLKKMRNHIEEKDVQKLAIPRLGCGLDKLEWDRVKHMMEFLFRDVNVEIIVCNFHQDEDPNEISQNQMCKVIHLKKSVADIEEETTIIYLSTEDGEVSTEMKYLEEKFKFLDEFKSSRKKLGDTIKYQVPNKYFILYGCIVRKTYRDLFDFVSFCKCLSQINTNNKKDGYLFVGIQAIRDNSDDLLMDKIITLLRNYLINVDIYVCWEQNLAHLMPSPHRGTK